MFTLLQKLGLHIKEVEGSSELDQLQEDIGRDYTYGLAICFDKDGAFQGVRVTEGTEGIIYKFGTTRGSDYTLVSRISGKPGNVVPRLRRNAMKILEWGGEAESTTRILAACLEVAEETEDEIVQEILKKFPQDASTEKRVFAYWALLDGDNIIPFCGQALVKDFLLSKALEDYALRKSSTKVRMLSGDGTCSVCGKEHVTVYGNFSDITCYNVDKRGFITGGLSYEQTPLNFPVCKSCILDILAGKSFVEAHLRSYFSGVNYWLLPDAREGQVYKLLLNAIKDRKRTTLGKDLETITVKESEVFGYLSDRLYEEGREDTATLNFFFYESAQASWRIVAEMRDILPSRIKKLYDVKEELKDRKDLIFSKKENEHGYFFNLPRIRPFTRSYDSKSNRKFLRYLDAIFQGHPIPSSTLFADLVDGIRMAQKEAVREGRFDNARYRVRDGWATYLFLDAIDAIHDDGGKKSMEIDYDVSNAYTRYMAENKGFFADVHRAAAFLTGCYVGQVMYAQYRENPDRDTQPFVKKFVGQKLRRDRLEYLYNEAKEKLSQYERAYLVRDLEPVLAQTWVKIGTGWPLNDEETTFAFNLGWALSRKLATTTDEEENPEVTA